MQIISSSSWYSGYYLTMFYVINLHGLENHLDKNSFEGQVWGVDGRGFDGEDYLSQYHGSDWEQNACDVLTHDIHLSDIGQRKFLTIWRHELKHLTFCNDHDHLW